LSTEVSPTAPLPQVFAKAPEATALSSRINRRKLARKFDAFRLLAQWLI
jgi:hypothetical protein